MERARIQKFAEKTQIGSGFEGARLPAEPIGPLILSFRVVRSRACAVRTTRNLLLSGLSRDFLTACRRALQFTVTEICPHAC